MVSSAIGVPNQLSIRRAGAADAPVIARIGREWFGDTYAAQIRPEDLSAYLDQTYGDALQRKELLDPERVCLLAEAEGRPVGYAMLRRSPANAERAGVAAAGAVELQRLYVDFRWQGRGVAQQLMQAVVEAARALGGLSLWLGVWEENPRAIRFYDKCGFMPVGSQDFNLGAARQRDRVMVLTLD